MVKQVVMTHVSYSVASFVVTFDCCVDVWNSRLLDRAEREAES